MNWLFAKNEKKNRICCDLFFDFKIFISSCLMPSILINDDKCPVTKEYIHEILKSPESVLQSDASVADKILNVSKWLFDKSNWFFI